MNECILDIYCSRLYKFVKKGLQGFYVKWANYTATTMNAFFSKTNSKKGEEKYKGKLLKATFR